MAIVCITPITKEKFIEDANKCWNQIVKRDLTQQEGDYAWVLIETEVLAKTGIDTMQRLHSTTEASLTKTITIKSTSWFNWALTATYKNFLMGPNKKSNG